MKKQRILDKLERAWGDFNEAFAGLTAEQMLAPGVTGDWSVRDLLAHVSWWEEEALKHLPAVLEGRRPPRYADLYGGIDAFNAQMTELRRELSLEAVCRQLEETHRRLVAYVAAAPDELFATETRFRRRLRLDTYSHYPLHTLAIREWREQNEKGGK